MTAAPVDTLRKKAARAPASRLGTWARAIVHLALWVLVLVLAARVLGESRAQLDHGQLRLTAGGLALIGLLLVAARITDVAGWHRLLRGAGATNGFRASARVYTSSELVRYLPGGVLHFAARYRYATRLGVAPQVVVATTAVDLGLRLASGLVVFALSIPLWPDLPRRYSLATAAALPLVVLASHPRVLRTLMTRVARRRGKVERPVELPYGTLVRAAGWYASGWITRGTATWLIAGMLAGPIGLPPSIWMPLAAATAMSWVIGVLTPIAPGGLGAREAAGVALLHQYLPIETGLAVMLVVRLTTTAVEFGVAGIAAAWDAVGSHLRSGHDVITGRAVETTAAETTAVETTADTTEADRTTDELSRVCAVSAVSAVPAVQRGGDHS